MLRANSSVVALLVFLVLPLGGFAIFLLVRLGTLEADLTRADVLRETTLQLRDICAPTLPGDRAGRTADSEKADLERRSLQCNHAATRIKLMSEAIRISASAVARADEMSYRVSAFHRQATIGASIFVVVVLVVVAGVVMASLHVLGYGKGSLHPRAATQTELRVGTWLEVKSPVVGLLILAVSLAFFLIYCVLVFPLETEGQKVSHLRVSLTNAA